MAWAFAKVATVGQQDVQLFAALARTAQWHVDEFTAQGLATTAWAFAKAATVGQPDAQLFAALARVAK